MDSIAINRIFTGAQNRDVALSILITLVLTSIVSTVEATTKTQLQPRPLIVNDIDATKQTTLPTLPKSFSKASKNPLFTIQHHPTEKQKTKRAIEQNGGEIIGAIPHDGLLVRGLSKKQLASIKSINFIAPLLPVHKLSPTVRNEIAHPKNPEPYRLIAHFFESAQRKKTLQFLRKNTVKIIENTDPLLQDRMLIIANRHHINVVSSHNNIRRIEFATLPNPLLDKSPGRIDVRANTAPPWTNIDGLSGTGQKLSIYDSGINWGDQSPMVPDLRDRVSGDTANWNNPTLKPTWADLEYAGNPLNHGTGVADAAVGNFNNAQGILTGIAYNAQLQVRPLIADANGLEPGYLNIRRAMTNAFAWGARVHNNSWDPARGTWPDLDPVLNEYSLQGSAEIDGFVKTQPTFLVVTAAGNSGSKTNTIGTLSCSKNALTVGSSGNGNPPSLHVSGESYPGATAANAIAFFSSRGPAPGGRLKPDLVTPGGSVAVRCMDRPPRPCVNVKDLNNYDYANGTSFSAPQVSGAAVLTRELLEDNGHIDPTGMLVKAILINGATFIGAPGPDNNQGWGRLNLSNSFESTQGHTLQLYDSLRSEGIGFEFVQVDQEVIFENVVFSQTGGTAITLTWYDPPNTTTSVALLNDLDLTLVTPSATYAGGVPSMSGGVTVANGPPDTANTTEKLILTAIPAACTQSPGCDISVKATRLDNPGQPFALVASNVQQQLNTATSLLRLKR